MYGFLLFLGAGLVLVGMFLVLSNLRNVARRKRILATATSPISQAMGGPIEIKGNIVPSEKGLVEAPLSGRQAVWTLRWNSIVQVQTAILGARRSF